MVTRTFFIEKKRAADFLEILNEMVRPYVAVMYKKGYKVQISLSDKEAWQLEDIGFYATNMDDVHENA